MPTFSKWILILISLNCIVASQASIYYTYDGQGNNVIHDDWGAAGQFYLRQQVPAIAGYGAAGDMSTAFPMSARDISLGLSLPPYRNRQRNAQHKTDMLSHIGQFIAYNIDLHAEDVDTAANHIDVGIANCDLRFNKAKCSDTNAPATSFPVIRSKSQVIDGTREQINTLTAYLDGSAVYGSDSSTAEKLRSRYRGRMKTYNGELPKNTFGVTMENPNRMEPDTELRAAGNIRANMNPILLAIQSLFIREHNRLADIFHQQHPDWNDEQLYQESRKWNVALIQSICYYEYLPVLGIQIPSYAGYRSTVNPGIDNFFATVAFRYGHSEVNDIVARIDDDGENIDDDYITLIMAYYYPTYALSTGIEPLLRGASFMRQAKVSPHFASSLQNYLFGVPAFGGSDLLAINIQRSRDHGVPSYNDARSSLGLLRAQDFNDITTDLYLQRQLKSVYNDVNNVEAYIGGMAEDAYQGSSVGELFYASIADQFTRIRDGDRFYFENVANGLFSADQIDEIKTTGLRDIILRNTDIQTLPENIYIANPEEPWPKASRQSSTSQASESAISTSTIGRETLRSGVYEIEWERDTIGGEDYLKFRLMCQADGWVGIGVAEDTSSAMVNADIVIARFSGGQVTIGDYWATSFAQPVLDTSLGGSNDVELISGERISGMTTVEFRRRVHTGDAFDRTISTTGATPVIYAWHSSSDDLEYHTALRRGKQEIEFFAPFQQVSTSTATTTTTSNPPPSLTTMSTTGGSVIIDSDKHLSFQWRSEIVAEQEWIDAKIRMQISGPAWLGIAIEGPSGGLYEADFIKVSVNDQGSCSVRDYWAESPSKIVLDTSLGGTDDSYGSFCYVSGGELEFEFKRPISTDDSFDRPFNRGDFTDLVFTYDDSSATMDTSTMHEKRFRIDVFSSSWIEQREDMTSTSMSTVEATESTSTATAIEGSDASSAIETTTEEVETPAAPVSTSGDVTLDEGTSFVLGYELFEEEIIFSISFAGQGFAAIGIPGELLNMVEADVIAAVDDGSGGCSVGDYWSTSFVAPVEDATNGGSSDLIDVECAIDGGTMQATFKRKLSTGDSNDRDINPESIPLIYAFATTSGGLQYHGPTGRGSAELKPDLSVFEQPVPQSNDPSDSETQKPSSTSAVTSIGARAGDIGAVRSKRTVFLAHTWFSGFGILLFAVFSVVLERVGRGWSNWKTTYYLSQMFSVFFILIAEIIALARSQGEVTFAHCALAYVLLFVSPIQAILNTYTYRRDRWIPAWRKLNHILDLFVLTLGVFQFWMALRLLDADIKAFHLFYAYITSITAILLIIPRSTENTRQLPLTIVDDKNENHSETTPLAKTFKEKSTAGKKSENPSHTFTDRPAPYDRHQSAINLATVRNSDVTIATRQSQIASNKTSGDNAQLFLTPEEFQEQVANGKSWTVIEDKIYDMEEFVNEHPGGFENIEDIIARDGTELYMEVHEDSESARRELERLCIGELKLE